MRALKEVFPIGKEISYDFSNDVFLRDFKDGKPVAYRLTGVLKVASLFADDNSKLLKFQLKEPTLNVRPHGSYSQTEFDYHKSPLDTYKNQPFYGIWNKGNISDLYFQSEEDLALVNLKKGLASLFQFKTSEINLREKDASGSCDVLYRESSPTSIRKTKRNCVRSKDTVRFVRPEGALNVKVQNHCSTSVDFLPSGNVEKIESRDYYKISLAANSEIGNSVDSFIVLKTTGTLDEVKPIKEKDPKKYLLSLKKYKSESLETSVLEIEKYEPKSFKEAVKELAVSLETSKIGTREASNAFIQLIPVAREAKKKDILKVLKSKLAADCKVLSHFIIYIIPSKQIFMFSRQHFLICLVLCKHLNRTTPLKNI